MSECPICQSDKRNGTRTRHGCIGESHPSSGFPTGIDVLNQHVLRLEKENERLREALKSCLNYIEVQVAYRGSMSVAEIEAEIARVRQEVGCVSIGHDSGKTLAAVDLISVRAALAGKGDR